MQMQDDESPEGNDVLLHRFLPILHLHGYNYWALIKRDYRASLENGF